MRHAFLEIFVQSYDTIIADTGKGLPSFALNIVCDSMNYQEISQYQHKLKTMRDTDQASGRSLFGIHRSRIHVIHKQKNIDIYYCSTGEQKAILAHILCVMNHVLQIKNNQMPIMLFDDAFAHYDLDRIRFFYDYMQYHSCNQFFLTNTEFPYDSHLYHDINLLDLETHLKEKESLLF